MAGENRSPGLCDPIIVGVLERYRNCGARRAARGAPMARNVAMSWNIAASIPAYCGTGRAGIDR
jgi:hypothetical protein